MKCKKKKMSEEWQGPSRRVPFSVMSTIQRVKGRQGPTLDIPLSALSAIESQRKNDGNQFSVSFSGIL